jgi:lysophospholipase L1-like esterase
MIPRKIVAIGASDFFGMGDNGNGGYIGRFKQWHEQKSDKNFFYNLSVRGETTTQIIRRLTIESLPRKPELLLLTAGSNDIRRVGGKTSPVKTSDEDFRANVFSIIKQGKALGDVVFIGTHPFDESRTTPFTYWNKQNFYFLDDQKRREEIVAQICQQEQVPFLDLFHAWLDRDYFQWLHEDGQHANSMGHDMIFHELKNHLESLYS